MELSTKGRLWASQASVGNSQLCSGPGLRVGYIGFDDLTIVFRPRRDISQSCGNLLPGDWHVVPAVDADVRGVVQIWKAAVDVSIELNAAFVSKMPGPARVMVEYEVRVVDTDKGPLRYCGPGQRLGLVVIVVAKDQVLFGAMEPIEDPAKANRVDLVREVADDEYAVAGRHNCIPVSDQRFVVFADVAKRTIAVFDNVCVA